MNTVIESLAIPAQLTAIAALLLFLSEAYLKVQKSKRQFIIALLCGLTWIALLSILASSGFFLQNEGMPPRMGLVIIPPLGLLLFALLNKKINANLAMMSFSFLTLFHVVRVPVELMIHHAYELDEMPVMLTYTGQNPDILIGLLAPIIWFLFTRKKANKTALWIWNVLGIVFLANIVFRGALSIPSDIQVFNLDQPNWAMIKYPMVLVPGVVVPLVLAAHVISIIKLTRKVD